MQRAHPLLEGRWAVLVDRLRDAGGFDRRQAFGVASPLRVCPLGAHVDHQGGVVTGLTIDRFVALAALPLVRPRLEVSSLDFSGAVSLDLRDAVPEKTGDWGDYVRAAVSALAREHRLDTGLRAVVSGDLPGGGLSSSAAILVAYLLALGRVNRIDLDREEVAALVQEAENEYVGVASGRLDQSIILWAEEGHLTRVDCRTFQVDQVPRAPGGDEFEVLVVFSGVRRALARSGFNARVDECRAAARLLLERAGQAPRENPLLSDVAPEVFESFIADLPQAPRRRAAHYFGEQRRVLEGVEAWRHGDLHRFGELMSASGASSIGNYECGTAELITLYELLRDQPGAFGARFSGGGFGGSCVALIAPGASEAVIEAVRRGYQAAHPEAAAAAFFEICRSEGPAGFIDWEKR